MQLIPSAAYGITNWFSLFFQINAQDYIHVGRRASEPCARERLQPAISEHHLQFDHSVHGLSAGVVEDAPFASHNGTALASSTSVSKSGCSRKDAINRSAFPFATISIFPRKPVCDLLLNQVQYGKFNYGIGVEASKTILHHSMTATANWSYRFTRNSSYNVTVGGTPGDRGTESRRPDANGRRIPDLSGEAVSKS